MIRCRILRFLTSFCKFVQIHLRLVLSIYQWTYPKSPFGTLDRLTASTWVFNKATINEWICSNQKSPLLPAALDPIRLNLVIIYLALMNARFVLYTCLWWNYRPVIRDGHLVQPGMPYYFGEVMQLVYAFSLYVDLCLSALTLFITITAVRFRISHYFGGSKMLTWKTVSEF